MTSSLSAFSSCRSGRPWYPTIYSLLLITLLSGCGTLPDAKPFADATNALSSAVKTSGEAVSASLRDAGAVMPTDESKQYEAYAVDLQNAWADRIKATQGAAAYAEAIADLIAAGKQGGETAKKVGDSLGALAAAVNIPIAAPVAGALGDIGRFIADRIAIVKASKTLEEAVAQAQPAVDRIAEKLSKDAADNLKPILLNAYKNTASGIKSAYEEDDNFATRLNKKRKEFRGAVLQTALIDQKKNAGLLELEHMQEAVTLRLKERDQQIVQASSAYKTRLQLVNALSAAATAWATAHRDLANAIREKRKITVAELQETVSDLRELIGKVRAL